MNLVDELHSVADALGAAGIPYAVCGGIAVSAHGAPRSTKDIDLVVHRHDVARVLEVVRPLGYTMPGLPMTFDAGTERERHVQRVSKVEGKHHLLLDLLLAEGAFVGSLDDRVEVALPAGNLVLVSRETLLRMKRLAARPPDLMDLESLEALDAR
ncbi:hypothetical protein BH11MYX3_BH11MYX3_27920 [soil metagenome]